MADKRDQIFKDREDIYIKETQALNELSNLRKEFVVKFRLPGFEDKEGDPSAVDAGGIPADLGGLNGKADVPESVRRYEPLVRQACQKYGIPGYEELILAMIMQESGGRLPDVMQSSESLGKRPNSIKDPAVSIDVGVRYFAKVLRAAGGDVRLALQSYNFGMGFIDFVKKRGGRYTKQLAVEFSQMMARKHGWRRYGDVDYVDHVLRYFKGNIDQLGKASASGSVSGSVGIIGDAAYPYRNGDPSKPDRWGFYQRWCTSYVAWRLNYAGYYFHNTQSHGVHWGDAHRWDDKARELGIPVSKNPAPGAVAMWNPGQPGYHGKLGHVAFVSAVNGNQITIEEYNWKGPINNYKPRCYNRRTISKDAPSWYIHFPLPTNGSLPGGIGHPVANSISIQSSEPEIQSLEEQMKNVNLDEINIPRFSIDYSLVVGPEIRGGLIIIPDENRARYYERRIMIGIQTKWADFVKLDENKFCHFTTKAINRYSPDAARCFYLLYERIHNLLGIKRLQVVSGWRPPAIASEEEIFSPHMCGCAMDIGVRSKEEAEQIADIAWDMGFRAIAIGGDFLSGRGFVHIDPGPDNGGWSLGHGIYRGPGSMVWGV